MYQKFHIILVIILPLTLKVVIRIFQYMKICDKIDFAIKKYVKI